jgi:hypothetical protein
MRKILISVLIGLLLIGCEVQTKHPNIFENLVCEPPCWENITPGITTKAEALAILSKIDAIDQPIIDSNLSYMMFDDAIDFTFYNDLNRFGFIYILHDRVSMISLPSKLDVTLQRAIELFGAPQSVLMEEHAGEYAAVHFLNPEKGIYFSYMFSLDKLTEIEPEQQIDDVSFFDPTQYQLFLSSKFFSYSKYSADETLARIYPWSGYGSVYQYMITSTP